MDAQTSGAALYKDGILDRLASTVNVAQFVSFGPGRNPQQRFCRLYARPQNERFSKIAQAIGAVLDASIDQSVNVRSFDPKNPAGRPFIYGLKDVESVLAHVIRLAEQGLHTIVNETIDVHDGGVSGVVYGGIIECSPDDTPRCVEKAGTASFPAALGKHLLATVYGFDVGLEYPPHTRVEFSIHPIRRGYLRQHTIIWQLEEVAQTEEMTADIAWPNRFSRFLGDKVFGLLVADAIGIPVPSTTVLNRRVAPFRFGRPSGTAETWIRTAPVEQVPGHFVTRFGWSDPFQLLAESDPTGSRIPSVIAQEAVHPQYAGASAVDREGRLVIEGVPGSGADYMKGLIAPRVLPSEVTDAVASVHDALAGLIGDVRLEWVYDGRAAWVVQLHRGRTEIGGRTIYPGEPDMFHDFDPALGLEALRKLVARLDNRREGIVIVGNVGITSHLGDILRRARVPSRIQPRKAK